MSTDLTTTARADTPGSTTPLGDASTPAPPQTRLLVGVFTGAIFCSAFLLFLVQPMFSKMALPLLGGTPAVWNTCMVFFQVTLLAGYLYSHLSTRLLGLRRQAMLHLVLVLSAVLALPIGISAGWREPSQTHPTLWLLLLLTVSLGLPFFVLSTTGPLLQRWFSRTGHPDAGNPYFLYAASNLGSLIALFGYPALFEPTLSVGGQSALWTVGYALFVVGIVACALLLLRSGAAEESIPVEAEYEAGAALPPSFARRLRWLLLAFAPSSLMLGVTTYITTDVAAVPLLWVIPLGLYLTTFVFVFARRPLVASGWLARPQAQLLILLMLVVYWRMTGPGLLIFPLHLATFFVTALVCHALLAEDRPPVRYLTEFYLWLAAGGALGGVFNALVAPHLFTGVVEYPVAIVAACLLRPALSLRPREGPGLDLLLPLLLAGGALAARSALQREIVEVSVVSMLAISLGIAVVLLNFSRRPFRFGFGVAGLFVVSAIVASSGEQVVHQERTFFGTHRVQLTADGAYHTLIHGTTLHGAQSRDPQMRLVPTTYYHPDGPIGQVFDAMHRGSRPLAVGVVGLGTGAMTCLGRAGERWRYFEIDPAVVRIAEDRRYFTYLIDCPPEVDVVLGDARLTLAAEPAGAYDLIVLDAFSSDAIPIHLMTREAVQLYLETLADGGVLAFHISNRHMDLEPVLGRIAESLGLHALIARGAGAGREEMHKGSVWFVMAQDPAALSELAEDDRWRAPLLRPEVGVWSDDFSNVLRAYRWRD